MDIPRIFSISESGHRIHNPFTPDKFATLGAALRLEPGTRVLDLGSGSGEMLCTWARDHGITGTGVDLSPLYTEHARRRAEELGVAGRVKFIHADAAGYVSEEKAGVAACVGAAWIGGGVRGTIELLSRSLKEGGIILIGEPYWLRLPPTEEIARGCRAGAIDISILGQRELKTGGTAVQLRGVYKSAGLTFSPELRLRRAKSGWVVYDIRSEGESLFRIYRELHKEMIADKGFPALLSAMGRKLKESD